MKFDDVVVAITPFGPYQKRTYFLVCLIGIPAALHTMVTVFIMATPDHRSECKLLALVYDILPSTTEVFSYAIGSRKLSANEQFFVGVQTVVSLLQTTETKQDVSFIAANKVYTSTNKTTIV